MKIVSAAVLLMMIGACAPTSRLKEPNSFPPLGVNESVFWIEQRQAVQRAKAPVRSFAATASAPVAAQPLSATKNVAAAPVKTVSPAPVPVPTRVNVDAASTRLITASTGADAVSVIFVEACLKTAASPNTARPTLLALGFKESGKSGTRQTYTSDYATATLSKDTRTNALGQCTVTPKSVAFEEMVPAFRRAVAGSGVPVQQLPNEEAYVIGNTGAVALVSRSGGALTRTQPGVFKP